MSEHPYFKRGVQLYEPLCPEQKDRPDVAILARVLRLALDSPRIASEYPAWAKWAREWLEGSRVPQVAVDAAREVGSLTSEAHALHQLAWAAKEATYGGTEWHVLRYVADAAIALQLRPR